MKLFFAGTLIAASCLAAVLAPSAAFAQGGQEVGTRTPPASGAPAPTNPAGQTITLDVRDAPIRQVLIQLFEKAKLDYSLDNAVQGFVTLKVTDQPFETVLKLVLRSSGTPLTYSRMGGIYEIKPRTTTTLAQAPAPPAPDFNPALASGSDTGRHLAVINLTYLDPYDVKELLGITIVPTGTRGGGAGASLPGGGGVTIGGGGLGQFGGGVGTLGGNGSGGRLIGGSNGSGNGTSGRPGR